MTNFFRPQGAFGWFSYTTPWDTIGGYRMFMPLSVVWTTLRFQRALSPCWAINDEYGLGLPATPEP
jgi:hypothetical protein